MTQELKSYERMQKAIFEAAQEPELLDETFVPYGRCSRHPEQQTSNGMFDTPCPRCEADNDEF